MFMIEVDGHLLPQPLSGHPALELCNTWAGWNSPPGSGGDYLVDYPTLAVWARHHGLLSAPQATEAIAAAEAAPARADRVLQGTRRLRGQLYELLTEPAVGRSAEVRARAEEARRATRLHQDDSGRLTWRLAPEDPVRLPLLAAADAAADLLTGPERAAVHACPGADCGWLFLDRRGRRRWCSMAVCGNRAKARAHAERLRSATE